MKTKKNMECEKNKERRGKSKNDDTKEKIGKAERKEDGREVETDRKMTRKKRYGNREKKRRREEKEDGKKDDTKEKIWNKGERKEERRIE